MLKLLWRIVNNAFFGLIIGIALSLVFYFLGRQEIKIGYTVLNTNVIAKGGIDKNITILFKKDTLPNLNMVEFAFWNNGTQYIDKKDISETIPLTINVNDKIQILDYKIVAKSRTNLNFDIIKDSSIEHSGIALRIHGDDGLEKYDGLKIQVLYSGNENMIWGIDGRIKGNLNSFEKYNSDSLKKYKKQSIWWFFLYLSGIIILPFFVYFFVKSLQKKEVHETKIMDVIFNVVVFNCLVIFCIYKMWNYIFYSGSLDWLLK